MGDKLSIVTTVATAIGIAVWVHRIEHDAWTSFPKRSAFAANSEWQELKNTDTEAELV
jgi:hypothetical protein